MKTFLNILRTLSYSCIKIENVCKIFPLNKLKADIIVKVLENVIKLKIVSINLTTTQYKLVLNIYQHSNIE